MAMSFIAIIRRTMTDANSLSATNAAVFALQVLLDTTRLATRLPSYIPYSRWMAPLGHVARPRETRPSRLPPDSTKDYCSRSTAAGFDERRGYVATANELSAITALSLAGLRRRVEAALFPRWAAS